MAGPTSWGGLFIHVILIDIAVHCTGADVIDDCVNVSTCIGTYGDIYNALTSDKNSFSIESALYPAKSPSSVRVFVNLYGQNGPDETDHSTSQVTKYTWSLNCLYVAFPAVFLEVSSLGSILVTNLTQELNITIPHFCCNVSVKDRKNIIESVLAAVSACMDMICTCLWRRLYLKKDVEFVCHERGAKKSLSPQ